MAPRILVLNAGSSSLKYACFNADLQGEPTRGEIQRIGSAGTELKHRGPRGETRRSLPVAGCREAFAAMLAALADPAIGDLTDLADVVGIGHRVVHGGERFSTA